MEITKLDKLKETLDMTGDKDSLILVKDGIIELVESIDYGEIIIKFHDNKIKQLDTTKKTKY